jgi:hypothetical protein
MDLSSGASAAGGDLLLKDNPRDLSIAIAMAFTVTSPYPSPAVLAACLWMASRMREGSPSAHLRVASGPRQVLVKGTKVLTFTHQLLPNGFSGSVHTPSLIAEVAKPCPPASTNCPQCP